MKLLFLFLLFPSLSFFLGCYISNFFSRWNTENNNLFRTYAIYKLGEVDLSSVVIAAFFNTLLGSLFVIPLMLVLFPAVM